LRRTEKPGGAEGASDDETRDDDSRPRPTHTNPPLSGVTDPATRVHSRQTPDTSQRARSVVCFRARKGVCGTARGRSSSRLAAMGWLAVLAVGALLLLPAASATPNPTSVTIAGDLQSELGCGGDWNPACAATHLTYDAADDVWQGTFTLPAGDYQYKAALNDSWDENYGLHAGSNGDNIPLHLAAGGPVRFYYDHKSHWVTDNKSSVI